MTDNWMRKHTSLLQKSKSSVDVSVIGKEIPQEKWAFKVREEPNSPFVPALPHSGIIQVDRPSKPGPRRQSAVADIDRKQKPPLPPSAISRRTSLVGGEKIRPSLKNEIKRLWAERASFSLFSRSCSSLNNKQKEKEEEDEYDWLAQDEMLGEVGDPMMAGFFVVDRTYLTERRKSTGFFS